MSTFATMIIFPKEAFVIKLDPFWQLQYILRFWAQRNEFITLCWTVFGLKAFGFTTRTLFILRTLNNFDMLLEVSAIYSVPLLAVFKMLLLLRQRETAAFLFDAVKSNFWDFSVAGSALNNYLQKRYKLINYLLLGHATTSSFYVLLHLIFAEVPIPEGREKWLPTLIYLPFNQDQSPLYEILYVILTWNMFMSVAGNGFLDFLFVYAAQHLCGQFMLLKELLRKLDDDIMNNSEDIDKFKSKQFQKQIQLRLAICVRHHNLLLKYGNKLRDLTSTTFGVQVLTTLITLVLTGYTLSENLDELAKSSMLLSFVFSSTVQFVIFAVQSADIFHQSCSVGEAAYQSNWYLFDASTKRGLTLVVLNAQHGVSMTGAGLVDYTNEIIVKMAHKVFSFITLLKSLRE